MSLTRIRSQLCTATTISSLCPMFIFHFGHCLCQSPLFLSAKSRNHVSSGMNRYIAYSPLKDFGSSYRPEWDLNPQPLNSVQTLEPTGLSGHKFNSVSVPTLYSYSNFISLSSAHISFQSLPSSVATFALSKISHR